MAEGPKNANKVSMYKDDTYIKLESDTEQIRTCTSMYLSPLETMGALHLFYEIYNNSVDECIKNDLPKPKKIYVTFNETLRKFTITDEGRGIPIELLRDVVTTKHYSTKFAKGGQRVKGQPGMYGEQLTLY